MKIHQLFDRPAIILTNEEKGFIKRHKPMIPLQALRERETVIAQNLVRKGVYEVSEDSSHIILKTKNAPDLK